jgi:hypothetical protein
VTVPVDDVEHVGRKRRRLCFMAARTTRDPDDPRLSPISLRKELLAAGLHDREIARLVADGTLHRVRYGAYVAGAAWQQCDEAGRHGLVARAVLKSAKTDVVLSHLSALIEWEVPLWDQPLEVVHVTRVDQRAGRREAGVLQHLGELRDGDIERLNGIDVTSPARTALDSLFLMDAEHGLTVVNDLIHRELTTPEELEKGRQFMERWPGSLTHDLVLRLADGRCGGSVGEGRTLWLCFQQGLPAPEPQYAVHDESGRPYAYLDFAWPELDVFLEFDGRIKYQELLRADESATDAVLREKKREETICRLTGWRCIRITWADLYRPERTASLIREAFAAGRPKAS